MTWCDGADERLAEAILERLFIDGNFGNNRPMADDVRRYQKRYGAKKLFGYMQHAGLRHWKLAQKHSLLRPFAWAYQLCRYARKGIAAVFAGESIFRKNKPTLELEEIWRRLDEE